MKDWRELQTPPKDQPMPKTIDHYKKILAMDDELIHEQKEEIASKNSEINKLKQKVSKLEKVIESKQTAIYWPLNN